MTSNFL